MKTLLIILTFIVGLIFTLPVYAAPYVYFNWTPPENAQISDYKLVLLGLPGSPIEASFVADGDDPTYFKAEYDLQGLPDGSYTLTGKIKSLWGDESPESLPYPFVKAVPGDISSVHLDF